MTAPAHSPAQVQAWLSQLQAQIVAEAEIFEPSARFIRDAWQKPPGEKLQGHGLTCVLDGGDVLERAGVAMSVVHGPALPPSATAQRPELAGRPFTAMGVSVVIHPRNPYAPTSHCNVRLLSVGGDGPPAWWFGGGFDLTPYYGFEQDCTEWHRAARDAVGAAYYPAFKAHCDRYFYLPHRQEPRGIGGVFFDDYTEGGFDAGFALMQRVGLGYWQTYRQLLARRHATPYGPAQRDWQLLRRGRYVEFNLVWDRGTHFGLQSGGRTESILMSLPGEVHWRYQAQPAPGSPEAALLSDYLLPKDWL